jgi:recombination associated protein RdgC
VPALRGSLTYARFFVEGDLPPDFKDRFMRSIRLRTMKPLEPDDEELERSGWCKIGDPFGLDLTAEDVFWNEHVVLGFRTDRWVIPGPALKTRMREASAAYLAKKGREKLTRKETAELKEMVSRRMRRQMSPSTRVVDLAWDVNLGIVRFFGHAEKPAARMQELFHKTFGGLKLLPESPYTLATKLGLSRAQQSVWNEMEMTDFGAGAEA